MWLEPLVALGVASRPSRRRAAGACGCAARPRPAARSGRRRPAGTCGPCRSKRGQKSNDLDALPPSRVGQPGDEDRRVAQIGLLDADLVFERRSPRSPRDPALVARLEQRAEHRIAVDARRAGPDEAPVAVDQRADLAIADRPEIEGRSCARPLQPARPPATTGSGRRRRRLALRPDQHAGAAQAAAAAKASSSVRSSPTNDGTRAAETGSRHEGADGVPLSVPAGLSSTTILPGCSASRAFAASAA